MSVIADYFNKQLEYESKYGSRTVVLLEKGVFYEIYEYDPDRCENPDPRYPDRIGHCQDLSVILNIIFTSTAKNRPHSFTNPYMIGFPSQTYERHRNVLLENNYTVVRVDQKQDDPTQRIIGEIISPGTEMDTLHLKTNNTNCVLSIYIECKISGVRKGLSVRRDHIDDFVIVCGLSMLDVITGKNMVSEVYSQEDNNVYAVQEIYRFLSGQRPREVLFNINTLSGKISDKDLDGYVNLLYDLLELNKYNVIGPNINKTEGEILTITYRRKFLERVFGGEKIMGGEKIIYDAISNNMSPVISEYIGNVVEDLNLERMNYGTISYILLLRYCYEHDEKIISRISKPETEWTDQSKHLILSHNAINQLDILPSSLQTGAIPNRSVRGKKKIDSLISILDGTSTPGGKRMLQRMLVAPITDVSVLNHFYDTTEEMISRKELIKGVHTKLSQISDLDKLHRKMILLRLTPKELCNLYNSYIRITEIFGLIIQNSYELDPNTYLSETHQSRPNLMALFPPNEIVDSFNLCLSYLTTTIDFEKLGSCKMLAGKKESRIETDESFVFKGYDQIIDELDSNIRICKDQLDKITAHLDSIGVSGIKLEYVRKGKSSPSIDRPENSVAILMTTQSKATSLKKKLSEIDTDLCGNLEFTKVTKGVLISSDIIQPYLDCLVSSRSMLEIRLYQIYIDIIAKMGNDYIYHVSISETVSKIDYIKTNAQNSILYGYNKPVIDSTEEIGSFLSIRKGRHPIIERIISSEYVNNDLNLGESNSNLGILLYGINSSGKSSLTKSIGLIIVMAQAGMFVPAELRYKPYRQITTRLSGNDDIFKGMSSFVVEMTELRNILKNANSTTLVLGDELCRGTESISGTSLTIATIEQLVNSKSSFVFSTHMHHLPSHPIIKNLSEKDLRLCHLSTYYDEKIGDLVYDRKIEEGPGNSVYGLEVCKSLSMDPKFIGRAKEIRRNLSGNDSILDPKKSRYNKLVYTDKCSMCGYKSDSENRGVDTHHIKEQNMADGNGMIETFHKNSSFNLVPLCSSCHHRIHDDNIKLTPTRTLNEVHYSIELDDQ